MKSVKMIPARKILAILLSIAPLLASAAPQEAAQGTKDSGGGRVVICTANGTTTTYLSEYFDAMTTTLKIDLGDSPTYQGKIAFVLDRLSKMDPILAKALKKKAVEFEKKKSDLPREAFLKLVPDFHSPIGANAAAGCVEKQVAINRKDPRPYELTYIVNKDVWNEIDETTRAGVVLHEIMYHTFRTRAHETDANNTRYFNMVVSSANFASVTVDEYVALINIFKLESNECCGSSKPLFSFLRPEGWLRYEKNDASKREIYFLSPTKMQTPWGEVMAESAIYYGNETLYVYFKSALAASFCTTRLNPDGAMPFGGGFAWNRQTGKPTDVGGIGCSIRTER